MVTIAAIDLSPISLNAARSAARLARKLGDRLLLVRVLEPVSTFYPELLLLGMQDLDEPVRKANQEALENLCVALADEGVEIEIRLLSGLPAQSLAGCAREENARLIVMGTHGRGASGRLLAGSVAQRTVLEAPCPVLVLREDAAPFQDWLAGKRPLRIVVGVDRTPASQAALSWIGQLRRAGPCDVIMVHEYWPPEEYPRLGLRGPHEPGKTDPEIAAVLRRELEQRLPPLPGQGQVALRIEAAWARVGDGLAEDAETEKADLVVVGTHQPHFWERLKTGSAALATLHTSKVPVVCVPGGPPATEPTPARATT
jgi:nucleotide-binding universal stress UspA family protein